MSLINYPPQVERKISAFVIDPLSNTVKINIPYVLNKAVSLNDFTEMAITIKTATTGTIKWSGTTNECKMYSETMHSYYAAFVIDKAEFTPVVGSYYKI